MNSKVTIYDFDLNLDNNNESNASDESLEYNNEYQKGLIMS